MGAIDKGTRSLQTVHMHIRTYIHNRTLLIINVCSLISAELGELDAMITEAKIDFKSLSTSPLDNQYVCNDL